MEKMSSRERMLAAFNRQEKDHVPLSPYINQGPRWMDPNPDNSFVWLNSLQRAEKMLEMGLDPTIDVFFPDPEPHPDVKIKTWRDTSGPEPLITKEYHTPAGILRQTIRETEDWCDANQHGWWIGTTLGTDLRNHFNMALFDDWNVSRRTEPWFKGPEDLEKLRYIIRLPEGHVLDEWRMDAQRAKEFAQKYDIVLQARRTIVGDAFQWFCDIEDFMVWMIQEPKLVEEFLSIFQDWALGLTQLALDADVDVVQRRGWYEVPTFWGPKYFKDYIVPLIQEETRLVHQAGKLHCYLLPEGHGAYADILKDMDVDILMGVDPRMLHGGDLKSLSGKLEDTKSFWGGVNAEVTLESLDEKEIEQAVRTAVEELDGDNGLVLSAFIFPETPTKCVRMLIDAWKKVCL